MYGCDDRRKPRPAVRVFPKLLSWNEIGRKYVNFADCSFHVKKSREGTGTTNIPTFTEWYFLTGRVVVAREMCISNSFTLEASFCVSNFGVLQNYHFNMGHFQEAGRSLCGALLDYYLPNSTQRESFFRGIAAEPGGGVIYQSQVPPTLCTLNGSLVSSQYRAASGASSQAEGLERIDAGLDEDSDVDDLGSEDSDNDPATMKSKLVRGENNRRGLDVAAQFKSNSRKHGDSSLFLCAPPSIPDTTSPTSHAFGQGGTHPRQISEIHQPMKLPHQTARRAKGGKSSGVFGRDIDAT